MEKNIQCECNSSAKEICCKMQVAGLRKSISWIEGIKNKNNSTAIIRILMDISNILKTYKCLPGSCLINRVTYVIGNIESSTTVGLNVDEKAILESVISELNCFIKNMEDAEKKDFWEDLEEIKKNVYLI